MGAPMALKLQTCGHEVRVYNRSRDRLSPLIEAGLIAVDSPADLLTSCDIVITMVSDAAAIAQTLLSGLAKVHLSDRTILQMGTIAPQESRDLAQQVIQAGGEYLEAPVLGSIPQVTAGSLIVMVGATPAQFQRWRPLLTHFGPDPIHLGDVGAAATVKLAMNQLIGSLTTAFSLSLALVQREGFAIEPFMDIVRQSALYAPTFDKKLQRMVTQDFSNPNFPTKHLLKDMRLFTQTAADLGLNASVVEAVAQVAQQTVEAGAGDADYSAVYSTINPGRYSRRHLG